MPLESRAEKRFKRQLLIISLTLSILVLAGAGVYFHYEKHDNEENKSRGIAVIAGMKADQLEQWNKERQSEVLFFSTTEALIKYAYPLLAGDQTQILPFRKALLHIMTGGRYENISLLNTKGQLIFSVYPSLCYPEDHLLEDVKTVVQRDTVYLRDFYTCAKKDEMRTNFLAPIKQPDGTIVAVMLFQLNPKEYLYPLLKSWPQPTETGEAYLVRPQGNHLELLSPLREKLDSVVFKKVVDGQSDWLGRKILNGEEGIFSGIDYRNKEVLADIRRIEGTNWFMITKVDTDELFRQFYKLEMFILLSTAFVLLLLWLSIAWLYRNRQQKMLKELQMKNLDLKRSQEESAATLYSIADGVITTDNKGMVLKMNTAAEKMTGWQEKEAIGLPIETVFSIINESTLLPEPNPVRLILNREKSNPLNNAALLVTKEGGNHPITHNGAPIHLGRGGLFGVVLVFRDNAEERDRHRLVETRLRLIECAISESLQDAMNLMVKEVNHFTQSQACFYLTFAEGTSNVNFQACNTITDAFSSHDPECLSLKANSVWSVCVETGKPHLYTKPANASAFPSSHPLSFIEQALVVPVLRQGRTVAVLGVVNKKNGFLPDDLDYVSYLADVAWEVTSGKISYDQLQASELKYRALIDNMNDTVWIIDMNGRLLDVNKAVLTQLGYTKEEILKLGLQGLDASHTKGDISGMAEAMSKDITQVFETTHRAKNGKLVPVEVSSNLVNFSGVQTIVSIARDISQRKRDEGFRHLLYEIASYSLTTGSLEELMVVVRAELGDVMDADHLYVALFEPENASLRPIVLPDNQPEEHQEPLEMMLATHVFTTGEALLLTSDEHGDFQRQYKVALSEPAPACWLGVPLTDGRSHLGVLVLQHFENPHAYDKDNLKVLEMVGHELSIVLQRQRMIKDLIQAKDKAEESDRLKTAFLANVSHEIRTPMNGIMGFMEMLGDTDLDAEERGAYLEIVRKSGQRLLATVNDIVEISKIEAGLIELHPGPMNLTDLMVFQRSLYSKEAEEKGLSLTLEDHIQGEDALVIVDRNKLESILSSLLNNALKFTHKGGVAFGSSLQEGQLLFYVRDTGIGIESDKLELIFQRFAQADLSNTRPYEGAGLGLAIVKAYVDKMGGHVWVDSVPGKGSTFYVQIPYEPVIVSTEGLIQPAAPLLGADVPVTILVAEDDDISFQYLEIILKLEGATILRASCGEDAIAMVKAHPDIDLVLMDVKMPGMNGLEATRRIRAFNPTITIIAQTAFAFDKDKDEAMQAGCTDFLSKPVKRQHLLTLIRQYVKREAKK